MCCKLPYIGVQVNGGNNFRRTNWKQSEKREREIEEEAALQQISKAEDLCVSGSSKAGAHSLLVFYAQNML